jgi:hypothetical protein
VAIAARAAEPLHQLAHELTERGGKVLAVPTDITAEADRQHLFETVARRRDPGRCPFRVSRQGLSGGPLLQRWDPHGEELRLNPFYYFTTLYTPKIFLMTTPGHLPVHPVAGPLPY